MSEIINNYIAVQSNINKNITQDKPKIIAVTKTFLYEKIKPLVDHGHHHFGENKVQEAKNKWNVKTDRDKISLHMIGKLQSNKAKEAVKIFDFIHSLDNEKLAKKLSESELLLKKKLKYFIQVNVGKESQKAGIESNHLEQFFRYCVNDLNLNIIGLMAIPPLDHKPDIYFKNLNDQAKLLNLKHLSMGMSNDYLIAIKYGATFVRIGSSIFGTRSKK